MVRSNEDICEALKEICEQHHVRRLDLHSSSSSLTGEDMPDRQGELNLLVEYFPLSELEHAKIHLALEDALEKLFGREIGLLRTDDIKLEFFHKQLTRRRTLLYAAQGQEES